MAKIGLILLAGLGLLAGCAGGSSDSEPDRADIATEFDFVALLANYADNIIIPRYREFEQASAQLSAEDGPLADYCNAIGTQGEAQARAAAQASWRGSMDVWQEAELFQVGPAAANGGALRNRIYSYNSSSPLSSCAVDQAVVLASQTGFDIQSRSFNSRGLDTIEYLLFKKSLAHTCPARIVETENWDQRPEQERRQLRCDYALKVAQDVSAAAQTLVQAWVPEGDNFRFRFVDPAQREANLEVLSDALFYIEKEVKDAKLGVPTGLQADCSQLACPEAVEAKYSETSFANIASNLRAFRTGLMGAEGPGFDDIIVSQGFPEVVERFNDQIDDALALIDQIDTSLYQQTQALAEGENQSACANSAANPLTHQEVSACSLHGLLKRITDAMRTDFVTIVDIDLPERAQSDND